MALLADRARLEGGVSSKIHLFAYHDTLAEHDERAYQRAVLDAMKSPHEVHWVSSTPARLAADYERYVHHQEEPYGDISSYAEYTIAHEAARHGVKVLLNGLGGDEVFVGYPSFLGPLMLDVLRERRFAEAVEILRVTPSLGEISRFNAIFAAAYHALPARLRNTLMAARAGRSGGLPRALTLHAARDAFRDYHLHDGHGAVNAALRGSIESWSIPRFLAHSDRMGLAAGVEGASRCSTRASFAPPGASPPPSAAARPGSRPLSAPPRPPCSLRSCATEPGSSAFTRPSRPMSARSRGRSAKATGPSNSPSAAPRAGRRWRPARAGTGETSALTCAG